VSAATWSEEVFEDDRLRLRWKLGEVSPETWMDFEIWKWNGDKLEKIGEGNVRFDGCMNAGAYFAPFHFCDREDIERHGRALLRIREIAAETIPSWDA